MAVLFNLLQIASPETLRSNLGAEQSKHLLGTTLNFFVEGVG